MTLKPPAAIFLAVGLAVSGLVGAAQAANGQNGGSGHVSASPSAHVGGGGGRGGGHGGGHGGHFGGHRGGGYGYGGLGLGLGLGALYYNDYGYDDYDYGPVPHDYHDNYPDDSVPPADAGGQDPPPDVPGYWYRCDDPAGYYPYVAICPHPWQAVPAIPPPPQQTPSDSRN